MFMLNAFKSVYVLSVIYHFYSQTPAVDTVNTVNTERRDSISSSSSSSISNRSVDYNTRVQDPRGRFIYRFSGIKYFHLVSCLY